MEQQKEKKRKPHANRRLEETQKKNKKEKKTNKQNNRRGESRALIGCRRRPISDTRSSVDGRVVDGEKNKQKQNETKQTSALLDHQFILMSIQLGKTQYNLVEPRKKPVTTY